MSRADWWKKGDNCTQTSAPMLIAKVNLLLQAVEKNKKRRDLLSSRKLATECIKPEQ